MPTPPPLDSLTGEWAGTSTLHRSWLEGDDKVHAGPSRLTVSATKSYATVTYTWQLDGETQEGVLVATANADGAAATWTDTWHSDSTLMSFSGGTSDDGVLRLSGTYPAGDGPDWGWRIEVEAVGGGMQLRMVNIDPEGGEDWAVQAEYQRAK